MKSLHRATSQLSGGPEASRATLAAMASNERRLTVAVSTEDQPMQGTVRSSGEPERRFTGWLGLLSVLEAVIGTRSEQAAVRLDEERADER